MAARVILLSDGWTNEGIVDPEELCEDAGELRLRGVLTSCLGVGDGYDGPLLRGLADNGGGRLHDAEPTSEVSPVLLGELDDIFGTVVDEAQIALTAPAGVRLEVPGRTGRALPEGSVRVPRGPVHNDLERVAVFKVTCPEARPNDERAFQLTASGRAADDGTPVWAGPMRVKVTAAEGAANNAQPRDIEVATVVARTWSADVVATLARMNRDGDCGGAGR
jgi:Ca-activated chloride channel family protein